MKGLTLCYRNRFSDGKMDVSSIDSVRTQICKTACVQGEIPHSPRLCFALKVLTHPGGTVWAVKEDLSYQNPRCSMQYMIVSKDKIRKIIEE